MAKLDFDALNSVQRYLQFAVFRAIPGALGSEREELTAEAKRFFADLEAEGKVVVRGIYDNTGIRADADFMLWTHAETVEQLTGFYLVESDDLDDLLDLCGLLAGADGVEVRAAVASSDPEVTG